MRILLVVHGFPPTDAGGTEIYVEALATALAGNTVDEVFVLTREADPTRPECGVRREDRDRVHVFFINNTFRSCTSFEEGYRNPAVLRAAVDVIAHVDPDIAHVHHLTCLSTDLVEHLSSRGIPIALTLHDYWMLCHRGQLIDLDGRRCHGPGANGCARCIPTAALGSAASYSTAKFVRSLTVPGVRTAVRAVEQAIDVFGSRDATREASAARLTTMRVACRHVDLFLAPSQTIADHFLAFGIPPERMERCDLGLSFPPASGEPPMQSEVLRVGFVGSLIPSKAPHVLLEAATLLPAGSVTVDVIGASVPYHGDDSYQRVLLPLLKAPFVRHAGPVPHDAIPDRLRGLDVLVLPSVWIENSPLVIREAFAAGVPVVASNLGGMAEMVTSEVDGLLFPAGDVHALATALRRLREDPGVLTRLRSGIKAPMSIDADAERLRMTYERLISSKRNRARPVAPNGSPHGNPRQRPRLILPKEVHRPELTAVVLNYNTADETWLAVRSLQSSFEAPSRIVVVDNGSMDGSATTLRGSLHDVEVVETGQNLGFSGGCNVGIRAALSSAAGFVLLVNSDAVLAPDAVGALVKAAEREPGAGILAPVLLARDEPGRIASAGISYAQRSGRMRHLAVGEPAVSLKPGLVREVDAVSGCVMLIRCEVFQAVGLLHEDYFFSFEDLELCLRARRAGFRTVCVSDARAYHEGCRSIGARSPRRVYFATRNHLRVAADVAPMTAPGRMLRSGFIVGLNLAYVVVSPDAPLVSGLAAVARGTWHHLTGRYGRD